MNKIQKELFKHQDLKYRDFSAKLTPTIPLDNFIGVRVPELRKLAKNFTIDECIKTMPHKYVEEQTLHGLVISNLKDYQETVDNLNILLPHVNNWASCDIISPKAFKLKLSPAVKNNPAKYANKIEANEQLAKTLKNDILKWINDNNKHTYTIRFGIEMAMSHFLDEHFDPELMRQIASIRSKEYYLNMMIAWYFAEALAKQRETALQFIIDHKLDKWVHNKAIQKAIESRRISPDDKDYLRSLKLN